MKKFIGVYSVALFFGGFTWLAAQNQGKFTARELFYGANRKTTSPPSPSGTLPTKTTKSGTPLNQPTASAINKAPTATAGRPAPEAPPAPPVLTVGYSPLGLRYSLLRRISIGQYEE